MLRLRTDRLTVLTRLLGARTGAATLAPMASLILYASKYGATKSIAERIAARLTELGEQVELKPCAEAPESFAGYERVIVGCSIYVGTWFKDGAVLLRKRGDDLRQARVWAFSVGGNEALSDDARKAVAEIEPVEHEYFRGVVDHSEVGFVERQLIKIVGGTFGDFRDWDAIDAFADRIHAHAA